MSDEGTALVDPSPAEYRDTLRAWLSAHAAELEPFRGLPPPAVEDEVPHELALHRLLYAAGWSRFGWPEEFGGLGGAGVLRGVLYEELFRSGYFLPHMFEYAEIVGCTLIAFAPHLARLHMPRYLAGDEMWSQGFSEPDAGSDLASLRTRAVDCGDHFRLSGQKVWTSYGQFASWSCVLARTGPPESRHRGISMLWVDIRSPGVEVRTIRTASGKNEFCEMFFDDVVVPRDRLVGKQDGGWAVAMYMLQFERGMYAWQRQSRLHARLQQALAKATAPLPSTAAVVGDAYLQLFALRGKCLETVRRLARGETPGPEISADKILLGVAEQAILDAARELMWPRLEIDGDAEAEAWRADWWYTRATTIFGGAAEVQRDIVAEHLLGLPKGRRGGG